MPRTAALFTLCHACRVYAHRSTRECTDAGHTVTMDVVQTEDISKLPPKLTCRLLPDAPLFVFDGEESSTVIEIPYGDLTVGTTFVRFASGTKWQRSRLKNSMSVWYAKGADASALVTTTVGGAPSPILKRARRTPKNGEDPVPSAKKRCKSSDHQRVSSCSAKSLSQGGELVVGANTRGLTVWNARRASASSGGKSPPPSETRMIATEAKWHVSLDSSHRGFGGNGGVSQGKSAGSGTFKTPPAGQAAVKDTRDNLADRLRLPRFTRRGATAAEEQKLYDMRKEIADQRRLEVMKDFDRYEEESKAYRIANFADGEERRRREILKMEAEAALVAKRLAHLKSQHEAEKEQEATLLSLGTVRTPACDSSGAARECRSSPWTKGASTSAAAKIAPGGEAIGNTRVAGGSASFEIAPTGGTGRQSAESWQRSEVFAGRDEWTGAEEDQREQGDTANGAGGAGAGAGVGGPSTTVQRSSMLEVPTKAESASDDQGDDLGGFLLNIV